MRVAIYTRLSQDRDGTKLSVQVQQRHCEDLAEQLGLDVVQFAEPLSDHDASAYNLKRPRKRFERLVQAIQDNEIDGVVVLDYSRLLRTVEDYLRLKRDRGRQITLFTVRAGKHDLNEPGDELLATIMSAVAKHESHQKSQRHIDANAEAAKAGRYAGGRRPLGYDLYIRASNEPYDPANPDHVRAPKELRVNEIEAKAIRTAAEDLVSGDSLSNVVRAASAFLEAHGREKPLVAVTFKKVLTSDRVRGERSYQTQENRDFVSSLKAEGKEWWAHEEVVRAKATWPPILTEAESDAVRQALSYDRRVTGGRPPRSLLAGLMTCGHPKCNGRTKLVKGGADTYQCSSRSGCGRIGIGAQSIEAMLVGLTLARLQSTPPDSIFTEDPATARLGASDEAEAAAAPIRARKQGVLKAYTDGLLSDEDYRLSLEALNSQLAAIRTSKERSELRALRGREIATTVDAWEAATTAERNRTMRAVLADVTILPSSSKPVFDPDRVQWRYRTHADWQAEMAALADD